MPLKVYSFNLILTVHVNNKPQHCKTLGIPIVKGKKKIGSVLTHCGLVTQICVFTLQLCRTGDADLRFLTR